MRFNSLFLLLPAAWKHSTLLGNLCWCHSVTFLPINIQVNLYQGSIDQKYYHQQFKVQVQLRSLYNLQLLASNIKGNVTHPKMKKLLGIQF